ncbi:hypothetical protein JTE90_010609 [Oedothorax gibbosus]|uniref:C2H2-type domain-containing protein n=1 Tax=Oedothorax gibbosus TaxID=931172 RepID=A0AAV6TRL0_9ARAC|nr:hypothetical protein JTE90_010609 [Oedothorax gibbosus]
MNKLHSCRVCQCGFKLKGCLFSRNVQQKSFCRVTCPVCRWDMSLKFYLQHHLHTIHGIDTASHCPFCWGSEIDFNHLSECFIKTFPYLFVGKVRPPRIYHEDQTDNPSNLMIT